MARNDAWVYNPSAALSSGLRWGNLGGGHGTATYADATGQADGALQSYTGTGNTPSDRWAFDADLGRWALSVGALPRWVKVPAAASIDVLGSITLACWFKSSGTGGYQCLTSLAVNAGTRQYGHYLVQGSFAQIYIALSGTTVAGSGGNVFTLSTPWTADAWHHLATTYDAATGALKSYLDGALALSTTISGDVTHEDADLSVGSELGVNFPLLGSTADQLIYERALTLAEVAALADPANFDLAHGGSSVLVPAATGTPAAGSAVMLLTG